MLEEEQKQIFSYELKMTKRSEPFLQEIVSLMSSMKYKWLALSVFSFSKKNPTNFEVLLRLFHQV